MKIKFVGGFGLFVWVSVSLAGGISLKQAEALAVARSPERLAFHEKSKALTEKAIASAQFADPKLYVGLMNIPAETFDFNQENMTQIQVGFEQALPKGKSLKRQFALNNEMAKSAHQNKQDEILKAKRDLRLTWAKLALSLQVKKIYQQEEKEFEYLVKVVKSMLANNKAMQQDVFRAELGLTTAKNKMLTIEEAIENTRHDLARLIGEKEALRASPYFIPSWNVKTPSALTKTVLSHPLMKASQSMVNSKAESLALAKEQFKPGFMLGAGYGFRQGNLANGNKRGDFVTLRLGVSAPLFPKNRQSRRLKSAENQLQEQEFMKLNRFRILKEQIQNTVVELKKNKEKENLFKQEFIPQADLYANATLSAYENAKSDFPNVARAFVKKFNVEAESLKIQLARAASEIKLMYLQGM